MVGEDMRVKVMEIPKLTPDEYSAWVDKKNREKRGPVSEPCFNHDWVRVPYDTDAHPSMICLNCQRTWQPDLPRTRPGLVRPATGRGKYPI